MLSRVADSLYWMSRYLERAEHTTRLVEVNLTSALDQGPVSGTEHQKLLLQSLNISLGDEAPPLDDAYGIAHQLTFDTKNSNSIVSCIMTARENARQVREQISSEMYEQLNRLYLRVRAPDVQEEWNASSHEFFSDVKEGAHLFQGVTDDTLSHGQAWQFIRVGRALERIGATVRLLRTHAPSLMAQEEATTANYLEWAGLLRSCTSFEAYCKEYTAEMNPNRIIEFLLLDDEMPRSVRFCADRIEAALNAIGDDTGRRGKDTRLLRAAGKLRSALGHATVEDILAVELPVYLDSISALSGQLHGALFSTYIRYTVDTQSA